MSASLTITNLSFSYQEKTCFESFSTTVNQGRKVCIIGRNGTGKSTLLKILSGDLKPTIGTVKTETNRIARVPQVITQYSDKSGAQRFNKALSHALAQGPDILCLDEPTNHLDRKNKQSLIRMIQRSQQTFIIVTHDPELIRSCASEIWHIDQEKIKVFSGSYDQYIQSESQKKEALIYAIKKLGREKKESHKKLMAEQIRARKQTDYGKNKYQGDRLSLSEKKRSGEVSSGKNKKAIEQNKQMLSSKLDMLYQPETIKPRFNLSTQSYSSRKTVLSISDGTCGYLHPVLTHINFSLSGTERASLSGKNGSGKSTLIHAILQDENITRLGYWEAPPLESVGYLDQHYSMIQTIPEISTVQESIQHAAPLWSNHEIREHLNSFLFRKNSEVNQLIATLSGGELARLSLAYIAAQNPLLLILDEVTNNIDLETREHLIQTLNNYSGTLLIISHDQDFLDQINITTRYSIENKSLIFSPHKI